MINTTFPLNGATQLVTAEKGIPQKKQEQGVAANALPFIKRGYRTDCHILKAPMSEVLAAAVDFGGTLILNICENYQDKQIIPDLIKLCSTVGIHFESVDELAFEQANLRLTI